MNRAILCGAVLTAVLASCRPEARRSLDLYFIDVEQGNAMLVVTPAGESMLIDAGSQEARGRDVNRVLAAACAIERSIRRVVPSLDRLPGASIWFSVRIPNPEALRGERPPTERTGGRS